MAHIAKIGQDDIVEQVIVVSNDDGDPLEFIKSLGFDGEWITTSYNHNIRGKFAGVGDKYDRKKDEFFSIPKPKIIDSTISE